MASQAECRRFDPDRPLQRNLSAKAFAKLVEIELARVRENERSTMAGRGAGSATALPRDVLDSALARIRAERSILERVRKAGEKRRVRPVLRSAFDLRPLPLVRLAGEVGHG